MRDDRVFVVLTAAHASALIALPAAPVIALGVWWNANTIAHNFIHRPFFRRRAANRAFAAALSALNGIPQSLWREWHLAHHAGGASRRGSAPAAPLGGVGKGARFARGGGRVDSEVVLQSILVLSAWTALAAHSPQFFLATYLPGYLCGLLLCALHGYYEHAGGTTSYYGRLYNLLLLNDGYHVEHHANPRLPWHDLPARRAAAATTSRWPAPLRWLECAGLDSLERLVIRSPALQQFVVNRHRDGWRGVLRSIPAPRHVVIVGGGLFPRSARIVRELLPGADITVVDASADHLRQARALLGDANVEFVHARYQGGVVAGCDLLVIPLAFDGDRRAIYALPPAPAVVVHDWIWRRRGDSRIVSCALLKRLNVVVAPTTTTTRAPDARPACDRSGRL